MSILLRPLEPEDLDDLYSIENDMQDWMHSASNVPYSRYALHSYIATQQCDIYADKQLRLVAQGEDGIVGLLDFQNFDPRNSRAEVGIIIRSSKRGRGYATEALSQLIDYARNIINIDQLYSVVNEENEASIRLFTKLGFEHTSTLKQWFKTSKKIENAYLFQFFLKKV